MHPEIAVSLALAGALIAVAIVALAAWRMFWRMAFFVRVLLAVSGLGAFGGVATFRNHPAVRTVVSAAGDLLPR